MYVCKTVCERHSYLHDSVISRDEDCEQVKVPGGEDKCKQHLRLPRDTFRRKRKKNELQDYCAIKSCRPPQTTDTTRRKLGFPQLHVHDNF